MFKGSQNSIYRLINGIKNALQQKLLFGALITFFLKNYFKTYITACQNF